MVGVRYRTTIRFDDARILRAMDAATAKAMGRAGAFIRQRAKSSIRQRRRSSPPGQPPSSHVGTLRRLIVYGYVEGQRGVVIGPLAWGRGEAPSTLEYGGVVTESGRSGRRRVYRPRPYMGPALEAELRAGTIPRQWAGSLRGA